jgi:hypothetical protein
MWALTGRSDLAQSAHSVGGVAVEFGLIVVGLVSVQGQAVSVDCGAGHRVLQDDGDPVGAQS